MYYIVTQWRMDRIMTLYVLSAAYNALLGFPKVGSGRVRLNVKDLSYFALVGCLRVWLDVSYVSINIEDRRVTNLLQWVTSLFMDLPILLLTILRTILH